jgi:hypothetical protein
MMCELDSSVSGYKLEEGPYNHSNEPSDFMKGEEFIEQLGGYKLLKKASAPWR